MNHMENAEDHISQQLRGKFAPKSSRKHRNGEKTVTDIWPKAERMRLARNQNFSMIFLIDTTKTFDEVISVSAQANINVA